MRNYNNRNTKKNRNTKSNQERNYTLFTGEKTLNDIDREQREFYLMKEGIINYKKEY